MCAAVHGLHSMAIYLCIIQHVCVMCMCVWCACVCDVHVCVMCRCMCGVHVCVMCMSVWCACVCLCGSQWTYNHIWSCWATTTELVCPCGALQIRMYAGAHNRWHTHLKLAPSDEDSGIIQHIGEVYTHPIGRASVVEWLIVGVVVDCGRSGWLWWSGWLWV